MRRAPVAEVYLDIIASPDSDYSELEVPKQKALQQRRFSSSALLKVKTKAQTLHYVHVTLSRGQQDGVRCLCVRCLRA